MCFVIQTTTTMTRILTLAVAVATLSLVSCASTGKKEECTSCCKADAAKKSCCDSDKKAPAHKH